MSNRNGASGKTAISYESDRERNLKETTGELNMLDTYAKADKSFHHSKL
jgi:hypothetical protein